MAAAVTPMLTFTVEMSDYEHLRKKPEYTLMQFWFDCMFWWAK
jgi:hypothetical protein